MSIKENIKKVLRWLWPSLIIIALSCFRKSIIMSLPIEQIQEGLLLYAGYLVFIIPAGIILSKLKIFEDETKVALLLVCVTYIFFEYSAIFATWESFAKQWVIRYFYDAQHTMFILVLTLCLLCMMYFLVSMNQKTKNFRILLFTTFVLSVVPFIEALRGPSYKYVSDLFDIQQSDVKADQANIPDKIFWIILDEYPSSLVLDEVWGYKDTVFRKGLESLGFTVYDSCVSNFNYSPFSIGSTSYGAMLPVKGPQELTIPHWIILGERIRQSPVMAFFRNQGYKIFNYSFMGSDIKKIFNADRGEIEIHRGEIVASSFMNVLLSEFGRRKAVSLGFYNWEVVNSLLDLMKSSRENDQRFFVYAHLIMPHGPYLPLEKESTRWNGEYFNLTDDSSFLSHVAYTDSIILDLFSKGFTYMSPEQKKNTLIILQADHGRRYLEKGGKDLRLRSSFGILNAVHWPEDSRGNFYNGMSSVNTFRIILRDIWGIKIDALTDSCCNVSPIIAEED
ncbi:MAG: sulfatase-like hydrolase/transferase [Bacteroidetes bacterium]|nr:sulfatase-like hydrolase/transferase [Bacteroidota bacterium]